MTNENQVFEMIKTENVNDIVAGTQRALMASMLKIVRDIKSDIGDKIPGMTWEQIEHLITEFSKKKPQIIVQEEPM